MFLNKNNTLSYTIFSILTSFLFLTPFFCIAFLQFNFEETKTYFIGILSLWGLLGSVFYKFSKGNCTQIDVCVLLGLLYYCIHFFLMSNASIYYSQFWLYISYFVFYGVLRTLFYFETRNGISFLHKILFSIVIVCVLQSAWAIFQYLELVEVKSVYFKLLGSFTTPNFLAAYLGIGFSIGIWFLFVKKSKNKWLKLGLYICLLLFGILTILSKSRAAWLAIIGSCLVFLCTATPFRELVKKTSIVKKALVVVFVCITMVLCGKYLYSLKPESVKGRALVAKITLNEIVEKPILGHGLFSFSKGYNLSKAAYFSGNDRAWNEVKKATYVFNPFNDYLLIWYELGVVGLVFFLALLWVLFRKMKWNIQTRLGFALLVNLSILSLFTSPLSNISLMLVGVFSWSVLSSNGGFKNYKLSYNLNSKYVKKIVVSIIAVLGIYISVFKLETMHLYANKGPAFMDSISNAELERFSKGLENNGFSDYYLGKRIYDEGKHQKGILWMEKGFSKNAAPRIGKGLATFYIKEGNYKRAQELFELNARIEPYRYEAKMDLLDLYEKTNNYEKLVASAKEIFDFPVKVPSKTIDTYKHKAQKIIDYYSRLVPQEKFKGTLSKSKILDAKHVGKKLFFKVYLPPVDKIAQKLPVVYINDGHQYLKNGNFVKHVDSLITHDVIFPIAVVFLMPKDLNQKGKNVRQELFLCNPNFVKTFEKRLMPYIEREFPVSSKREERTILGVSFGGLAAAYFGDQAPHLFKNIAMQSPAFHPCKSIYESYRKKEKRDLKMFLSYGTGLDTENQDLPMIQILKEKKYDLKVVSVENGNHDWSVWEKQIPTILKYFYVVE